MKKSTRKAVEYLKRYVGHEIIRIKPTNDGGTSYLDMPILLTGITEQGCMRYQHIGDDCEIFGSGEGILPVDYTDRYWIDFKKALKPRHNELNKWKGRRIARTRPTASGQESFMETPVTLVFASRHHVGVKVDGSISDFWILGPEFSNPNDWKVVDY